MGEGIRIGLIGTGFMGKSHAIAFASVGAVMNPPLRPVLTAVADLDAEVAASFAARFGFERSLTDWRALVAAPDIDLVAITSPNALHKEVALAAIAAGKHVYCEKPLALTAEDAREMAEAAERAGVVNAVGYNYLGNPVIVLAKKLIESGEIGEIVQFRGDYDEDYMADPAVPYSWRCHRPSAGTGALGDLGSHLVSLALHLVGPVEALCADTRTVIGQRPLRDRPGETGAVENEDLANALVRFQGGALGHLGSSRIAWGRKNRLAIEITGTKGTILFDQERMNELQIFQPGPAATTGFRTILANPSHPPYGAFVPAPGHQLGFNDLKTIEVAALLRAVAEGAPVPADFRHGLEVGRVLDAIVQSSAQGGWVRLEQTVPVA